MQDFRTLKRSTFKEALQHSLTVLDEKNNPIAALVPIGEWALSDEELVNNFGKWRQTFMRFFLSQFEVSAASTKGYLQKLSINQPDRIFFAIYVDDELFGHIGLSNVNDTEAELDNIIRGKSGGHNDLMYFSEKALLDWAFYTLKMQNIVAQVMSKNFMAISLHQRFGFELKEQYHLKKITTGSSVIYERCDKSNATEKFFLDIIAVDFDSYVLPLDDNA